MLPPARWAFRKKLACFSVALSVCSCGAAIGSQIFNLMIGKKGFLGSWNYAPLSLSQHSLITLTLTLFTFFSMWKLRRIAEPETIEKLQGPLFFFLNYPLATSLALGSEHLLSHTINALCSWLVGNTLLGISCLGLFQLTQHAFPEATIRWINYWFPELNPQPIQPPAQAPIVFREAFFHPVLDLLLPDAVFLGL